ncbi:MAG: serine acetyltransferase [Hornefia sp.]|nr:serine acetyltransferase [Hornefia sp.]
MNCKKIDEMKQEFKLDENAEICCACEENEFDDDSLDMEMDNILRTLLDDYEKGRDVDKMEVFQQPDQDAVKKIIKKLLMILYPGYYREKLYRTRNTHSKLQVLIEDVIYALRKQIEVALLYDKNFSDAPKYVRKHAAQKVCLQFFATIPKVREYLNTDIQAAFEGDPAASSKDEIVLAYPGLLAITIYRFAHELFLLNVPLIPRMMTEYAHRHTGVDIHPGATIGKYFFIDHATGIVIGSTSLIGERVKIYQGVTIGALSTKEGQKLRGKRRHPTIEDEVTLYSGASILGGDTVIGKGSVIGGNSFITKSVAPYTTVTVKTSETVMERK